MRLPTPTEIGEADLRRLFSKMEITPSGCVEWTAATRANGYGAVWLEGAVRVAHRVVLAWAGGHDDPALDADHLCRNRKCVAPAHLELVTRRENIARGQHPNAQSVGGEACPRGHDLTAPRAWREWGGQRSCRLCQNFIARRRKA